MNILVMLVVLLAQQAVLANGALTQRTKHLLKTGLLFKLEKTTTDFGLHADASFREAIKKIDAIERRVALREIYRVSARTDEAREIVAVEHGAEELKIFNYILKLQEAADSLGVDIDLKSAMAIRIAMSDKND